MRGVRHQRSPAYQARQRARELDRQLASMQRGGFALARFTSEELEAAQRDADDAWSEAYALSREATHAYKKNTSTTEEHPNPKLNNSRRTPQPQLKEPGS